MVCFFIFRPLLRSGVALESFKAAAGRCNGVKSFKFNYITSSFLLVSRRTFVSLTNPSSSDQVFIKSHPNDDNQQESLKLEYCEQSWKELRSSGANEIWEDSFSVGGMFGFTRGLPKEAESFVRSFFSKNVNNCSSISFDQWSKLRRECIKMLSKERLIDSCVLAICTSNDEWVLLGLSYINYLLNLNLFNPASVQIAATLIYRLYLLNKLPRDDPIVLNFLNCLDKLKQFGDGILMAKFVAVCCTTNWKRSLELLPQLNSSKIAHTRIAVVCFKNDEPKLGLTILRKFANENGPFTITKPILDTFFNCLLRMPADNEHVESEKFFAKFVKLSWLTSLPGIHSLFEPKLRRLFEKFSHYSVQTAVIRQNGRCDRCNERLEPTVFSEEDMKVVKDFCWHQLLNNKHIYSSTTPVELKAFKKFVDTNKPFDVVVDGMNIMYQNSFNCKLTPEMLLEKFEFVLDELKLKKFNNMLLLLRKHVFKNHPQYLAELEKKAHVYCLDNISTDDSFALFATASSGPACCIMSGDKFGFINEHAKENIPLSHVLLLLKWKRARIIVPKPVGRGGMQLIINMPPRYDLRLHIAPDGFHIPFVGPFVLESGYNPKLEEETKWLCVKEKNETHCSD